MSVSINDLQPKKFKIEIKGVELEVEPLNLSQMLIVASAGKIFQAESPTKQQIINAGNDMQEILDEVIPELKGKKLDGQTTLDLIGKIMNSVEPDDNKELNERGVKFDVDPKAGKIG